jgi:hypothetical protein
VGEDTYPERQPHFDRAFLRTLIERHAANAVGSDGCLLLAAVVLQEDAQRYSGPVDYWNGQLVAALGVRSVDTLERVRARCIEAGWLHYVPGSRSRAARYWVTIPERTPREQPQGCGTSEPTPAAMRDFTRSERGTSLPTPVLEEAPAGAGVAAEREAAKKTPPKSRPGRTRRTPDTPHHRCVGYFKAAWERRYGGKWKFNDRRDGKAVKQLLGHFDGDEEEFRRTVDRYLADEADPYLLRNRHPLSVLSSQVNKWQSVGSSRPGAAPVGCPDFGRQPPAQAAKE